MECDQREIEYWLENNKVRNDDIESRKNLACFKHMELLFKGELHCLRGYFRKKTGMEDVYIGLNCFCASPTLVTLLPNTI